MRSECWPPERGHLRLKNHQKVLSIFYPQTSPSRLTLFSKTESWVFLNRKRPTTFIANIAGMNPLKFFIESIGRVFQTLKKYQKRKKRKKNTKFFQGFSSFNHLPISSPGSLFFFEQCCGFQRFCTTRSPSSNVTEFSWISWRSFESVQLLAARRIRGGICCWGPGDSKWPFWDG